MPKWIRNKTNPQFINYIANIAAVSLPCAQVLINRGIKTPSQINDFLNPRLSNLSDVFELPDMQVAIARIKKAQKLNEIILICGDYDADGLTATAILFETLNKLGIQTRYFIPNRFKDGYGFSPLSVKTAQDIGAKLIITVDCGITSIETVSLSNSLGIDVIITDHHKPLIDNNEKFAASEKFILPNAVAIINPRLINGDFISGAGISFKLAMALFGNNIDDVYELLDLAAIGTAADVVPLIRDNRVILKEGMDLILSGNRAGIKALKEISGIKDNFLNSHSISFVLAPRINAPGRMADASDIVNLLTTKSFDEANRLANWVSGLNKDRKEVEEAVYKEAILIADNILSDNPMEMILVLAQKDWHIGVLGIVASRLSDKYNKPTIVLSIEGDFARGSGRSVSFFDIHKSLCLCKELLKRFGGHAQAVGMSIEMKNLEDFRTKISNIASETILEEDLEPILRIDAETILPEITFNTIREIQIMEPFGYGNEEPIFGAKEIEVLNSKIVGNNHLKIYIKQNGKQIDAIGFDLGDKTFPNNSLVDIAYLPTINEWEQGRSLQLKLKDIRPNKKADEMPHPK